MTRSSPAWLLAVVALGTTTAAGVGSSARFPSPLGRYTVTLERIEERRFTREEQLRDADNVDHVRWSLVFTRAADGEVVARAEYADVYGFDPTPRPAAPDAIAGWLTWSPEEQLVVLPAEGWASAPGTSERTAIALDPALGWKRGALVLDDLVWADALVAVGARHDDCEYAVDAFDGNTGRQRSILPSQSPLGWVVDAIDGRKVRVRHVTDNCAPEELRRAYVETCRELDLDTLGVAPIDCAAGDERRSP